MSKRSSILVGLFCVMALVAGCGDSNPAAVGDTVAPAAVLDVTVQVVSNGVDVVWSAGTEPDLAGYNVYRSVNGGSSTLMATETTTTFHDGAVSVGSVYRYEVSVVDDSGNESPRVATVDVSLTNGLPHRRSQVGE